MFKIPFELQKKYPNKYYLTTVLYKRAAAIQKIYRTSARSAIDGAIQELLNDKLEITILSSDEFKNQKAAELARKTQQ